MHAGLLGVVEQTSSAICGQSANVRVTDLEWTLIDMAVRPYYSGGVASVLQAFRLARGRVDVSRLARYLAALRYVYPYHQAIGWYMMTADVGAAQMVPLAAIPRQRDFYLTNRIESPVFDRIWRIHVPSALSPSPA